MFNPAMPRHYFYVGKSNILTVFNVLNIRNSYHGADTPIKEILDFGCGHGRVTRWFKAAFPEAKVWVTDFDETAVKWCVEQLGCLDGRCIEHDRFDLVWLGSVFTHLPAQIAEELLRKLLMSLRPNGVLIFTTQGRFSIERLKTFDWDKNDKPWARYHLDKKRVSDILNQYYQTGYGYVDYPGKINYGVCVANSRWYSERALRTEEYIQILFQEKGSDNHQDVIAFMRADLLDERKGPLW